MKQQVKPKKSLGQNFLKSPQIISDIVKLAGKCEAKTIIEIGPGEGALTREILKLNPKQLIAIDKDQRIQDLMQPLADNYDNFTYIEGDILDIDFSNFGEEEKIVIANLPYYIAAEIYTKLLESSYKLGISKLILMFQKEVALRIVADVGDKDYSRLSIFTKLLSREAEIAFDVPNTAFYPIPKVTSSVVVVEPLMKECGVDLENFKRLTGELFKHRRKILRKTLNSLGFDEIHHSEIFREFSQARPEELTLANILEIAKHQLND